MMDEADIESCSARGEFYLCLARAFMTPLEPAVFTALREALAEDLVDLGRALGYSYGDPLAHYRDAIQAIPDHHALLRLYSQLFVTPPRPVRINTGSYIDGAVNGASVAAMEAVYRKCGVQRGSDFHDLADHLSVQLEFVALLYLRSAEALEAGEPPPEAQPGHFLHDYVARGLQGLLCDLEQHAARHKAANPYLPLARLLGAAVGHDAVVPALPPREQRKHRAITKARHDRAVRGVTAGDMEFIARKLRERGLSTDHLGIPPERRDEAAGLKRKQPPAPRRGSRYG